MKQELEDTLNVENYLGKFKSIVPTSSLDGLADGVRSKLESLTSVMKNGGSLGDIARNIF